jgi:hypothetical protein
VPLSIEDNFTLFRVFAWPKALNLLLAGTGNFHFPLTVMYKDGCTYPKELPLE